MTASSDSDTGQQEVPEHLVRAHCELRRNRNLTYWSVTLIFLSALLVAAFPVPYLMLSPGPMYNTTGSVDGVELIQISDTKTYPVSGELNMTTVLERGGPYGGLTLAEAYFGWLRSQNVVAPVALFYAPETTQQQAQEEGALDFSSAQSSAIAAALGYLDIPVTSTVIVSRVVSGGPASGRLVAGDQVVSVNGTKISNPEQLPKIIRPMRPGSVATFIVSRQGQRENVPVTVAQSPMNPAWGYVGVTTAVDFTGPFPITFGVEGIGGPSAGLMFSLGIIDKLTPEDLANGQMVAGTGTIDPLGGVGSIGGITQKLYAARDAGAALFLAPADNCEQVAQANIADLNVARVESLDEAMSVLAKWRSGETDLPRCR